MRKLHCRRLSALATGVLAVEAACKALSSLGFGGEDLQGGPPESALLRTAAASALSPETPGMQAVQTIRDSLEWPSTPAAGKVIAPPPVARSEPVLS